tara:strand:- start:19 stop:780 length:762 start_codon:yes stop_codon:yes gene_type:complete
MSNFKNNLPKYLLRPISFILLIVIWALAAIIVSDRTLPGPLIVVNIFIDEIVNGELLKHLGITLYRVTISFFLAMSIGTFLGIIMGSKRNINLVLDGWNLLFLNIPALVTIILCYVWFGLTDIAAIIAVSLNKIPNVIVTVREGALAVDRNLLEVAKVFKVGPKKTFFKFFLPQLYPYIMAAARGGIALIWKIVLVVELLGRSDGVGFKLHEFFQFFDIASILAYTLAFVAVMVFVEYCIVTPIERKFTNWRL